MALFDTLKRYTGINVVECSSVRDFRDLDISVQNKIENGRLSGWLDKDTRTVRIYTGRQGVNEDVNRQRLVANVLNLSLAQLGWDGFFLPERKASALNMLQILADNDGFFKLQPLLDYENANPVKMLNEWITDTRPSKELTAFLCRLLELPNAESVERNIQFAMNKCLADRVEKLKNEENLDVLSEDILQALRDPKHRTSVSIGIRPHALMRCGYPPYPVRISTQWIQGIQKESDLSNEEFAKAFASSIRNPIAVMESTMISKDGENQYIILLDIVNKSGKRAALLLDRPGKVADNIRKNRFNQMSPYSPLWMTPNQVVFHINHGKAKNMREKGEEGSRDFDLVREIEKSEPGPSAVRNSASDARVLRIDTKVVENFFNSKYYTENFSRLEEDAKNAEQIQRKAAEQPAPDTTVKPVATDNRTIQEKMAAGIDGIASLSAKEKARLHEMKIHTLGELRNAGPAALSKTFNKAQITNFECILEENGLSFYTRPRAVSPSEFATFNEITKAKKQREDFITALQYIRQDKISGVDIPYPTKLDHSFFEGEAAVHMFVKSASRSVKWDWAPVFISTEEMQRFRLTPSASADPVHVKEDGVWKSYYNITETNLKEVNPELYAQELKFMDEECVTGLSYPATALSTMLAIRELTGYPQKGPDAFTTLKRRTEGMVEYYGPRFTEEVKKELDAEFSVGHGRNNINKDSDEYRLATEMTKFLVDNLKKRGVKIEVATEEQARAILERERLLSTQGRSNVEFSMRDIINLSYTWNGEEVSMRGFAEQFMLEIKQKDRTMEDAERIAKAFIEAVKADPEKAGMKMLKAENMANAFRFKLPDGTVYTPEHPMSESPEYETQKGLWEIYEYVLGKETMREFIGLLSKNAPMSQEERKRYSELESRVSGSDVMQRSLEIPASKVNENRVKDIRNLIQYFEGNDDYTWTEKALIVKGAMSFGYSEKKEADSTRVEIKNISDNNSVSVPVIGGEAAAVVEGLRKGLNFKDALVQARIMLSKESKRSVGGNFTGWRVYKQSDKEEDAVILNQDVAGTGWCTGGAVSTARSHLSEGDFHVYYEAGEPLIAIRTNNGRMAEPPRGAHEGQFCKPREEQIAFDYIRSGNGIVAGDDYIADIEDIRHIMSPDATPLDAFLMPEKRRYENGEFGDDTKAWGESVEHRIAELVPDKEERWKLGLYYGYEIEDACKNGNAIVIKGDIELYHTASLTLPEGVTQVEGIYLHDSSSLILPEGVTQVGDIRLYDSSSITLPEGMTQVGSIFLSDSSSITLPEGVTQVGRINLYDSVSLNLPKSVTQVGGIKLHDSSSLLTLPEGVTQVGIISLYGDSSLILPEGVTQVGGIYLSNSASLTLPEGMTQVGSIFLSDSSSLTLPEGVTQVGDIKLTGSASLTLPEGVTQVGHIILRDSSSLILPEGVTQVGDIFVSSSASLTLPEGVTQMGSVTLAPGASITFPNEFVLSTSKTYSAEEINQLISEHQKEQEFRLADGTIYGYQQGDTIYLTPAGINPNTPIHEYAHLWSKVLQQLEPEKWESLKEELKSMPEWAEIAASADYEHIRQDEDRLAGEVLATVVGNKGEDLQMEIASQVLSEGKSVGEGVAVGVERLREKLNNMVAKDVFGAEELTVTGETTLKVLKDFVKGKGVKIDFGDGERLAAMTKKTTAKERNDAVAGYSSFSDLSDNGQGTSKPLFHNSISDTAKIQNNTQYIKRKIKHFQNEHDITLRKNDENAIVSALGAYLKLKKSKSSNSFYNDYYEGDVNIQNKIVRIRISQHPANKDRLYKARVDEIVSIVVYKDGETSGTAKASYSETPYYISQMKPEMILDSIICGIEGVLNTGKFIDKYGQFATNYYIDGEYSHSEKLETDSDFQISVTKTSMRYLNYDFLSILSYDDKIALFSYFSNNGKEALGDADKEIITKAYQTAIAVPTNIPEVDESIIRNSISTSLNLALENLSEEALDAIAKHVKIERATEICINNPLRANTLLGLADSEGVRMLEALYEKNLRDSGIQPLTIRDIKNEMRSKAESAAAIIITDNHLSIDKQIEQSVQEVEQLVHSGRILGENKVFIRESTIFFDAKVSNYLPRLFSEVAANLPVEIREDGDTSVEIREDGTTSVCTVSSGDYPQTLYYFSENGMLVSAIFEGKENAVVVSPAHAIAELFRQVRDAVPNMNILEIAGLQKTVNELTGPISRFSVAFNQEKDNMYSAYVYRIDEIRDSIYALNKFLSDYKDKAKSEFLQFAERGFRTNNTLFDRITGKTFNPTVPLPSMDCIKRKGVQFKEGSISVKEIMEDNIPVKFYQDFIKRCCENPERSFDIDYMLLIGQTAHREPIIAETKELLLSELPQSEGYDKQLELCGRINKPIPTIDGNYIIVQQDGDHLISMKPEDAQEVMKSIVFDGKVKVDGVDYTIDNDNLRNIASGTGQWLKRVADGERAYVVFNIKQQRPVLASNYESALRKVLSENSKKAQEKAQNEGLNQNKSKQNKKGSNGIK